jgi:thiamine biosynthesis lipoprotein
VQLHRRWDVWGTYVHLGVSDAAALDAAYGIARFVLDRVGHACSRFEPDSDLSRVNRAPGRWVRVDPLLVAAVEVAVESASETDGLVDPCLGRTLVSLGYDADLDLVRRRAGTTALTAAPAPTGAWRAIETTPTRIRIPEGCALDLGSTAKAWTSDLIAAWIREDLGVGAVISVGGDVAIAGSGRSWVIGVTEEPDQPPDHLVGLSGGGLATSSVRRRRWTTAGVERHHLIDPRTGQPTTGPWRTVTATGPSCLAANLATTASIVLGEDAVAWLDAREVDARLVHQDGSVHRTGAWPVQRAKEMA